MKDGVVHQIGKPQEVYDDPINLFVAKFLGTPPINVFQGKVKAGMLYVGDDAVLAIDGVSDRDVVVGIRPEGFVPAQDGGLVCKQINVEVMGRDVSIVSSHPACETDTIRSIILSDTPLDRGASQVRFHLKPGKVLLFDPATEERIRFTAR